MINHDTHERSLDWFDFYRLCCRRPPGGAAGDLASLHVVCLFTADGVDVDFVTSCGWSYKLNVTSVDQLMDLRHVHPLKTHYSCFSAVSNTGLIAKNPQQIPV